MPLAKETKVDQITITENGIVLYRQITKILEDDQVISTSYHRNSLTPGSSLTDIPSDVANVCNLIWTETVIEKFKESTSSTLDTVMIDTSNVNG
jgi:hypothetical protein